MADEGATLPEARLQRGLAAPAAPTELDKEAHLASGHQPYRAWCAHCVRVRGRARSHLCGASSRVTAEAPVVHMDDAFFTAHGDGSASERLDAAKAADTTPDGVYTVLVFRFLPSAWLSARVVSSKGADPEAVAWLMAEVSAGCFPRIEM